MLSTPKFLLEQPSTACFKLRKQTHLGVLLFWFTHKAEPESTDVFSRVAKAGLYIREMATLLGDIFRWGHVSKTMLGRLGDICISLLIRMCIHEHMRHMFYLLQRSGTEALYLCSLDEKPQVCFSPPKKLRCGAKWVSRPSTVGGLPF